MSGRSIGAEAAGGSAARTNRASGAAGRWSVLIAMIGRIIYRSTRNLVVHEGFELSGYAAFTALLSIFPALIFLITLAGFFGDAESAERVIEQALKLAPREVVDVLAPVVRDVASKQSPNLMTFSILFALYSASNGIEALRTLLNRSYGVVETRPIWLLRPQSVCIVVVGAILTLVMSVLLVLGPLMLNFLRYFGVMISSSSLLWALGRYGASALIVTATVGVLHLILPNRKLAPLAVLPGAIVTALLWLSGAALFSLYVENIAQYSVIYGSLGGIILTLFFFYLTAIVFVFGAELNESLMAPPA
jgi:membrane protein